MNQWNVVSQSKESLLEVKNEHGRNAKLFIKDRLLMAHFCLDVKLKMKILGHFTSQHLQRTQVGQKSMKLTKFVKRLKQ